MLGFGRSDASLALRGSFEATKDDLQKLLERFAYNDDTYDLKEEELDRIIAACKEHAIEAAENRGLEFVRKEKDRRTGDRRIKEYASAQEALRVRRTPWEVIRDMGLDIRHGISSICRGIARDLTEPRKEPRQKKEQLVWMVERLPQIILPSITPVAAMVGEVNPGQTQQQAAPQIIINTDIAAQSFTSSQTSIAAGNKAAVLEVLEQNKEHLAVEQTVVTETDARISALEQNIAQGESALASTQENLARTQGEVTRIAGLVAQNDEKIAALSGQQALLEKEADEKNLTVANLETNVQATQGVIAQKTTDLGTADTSLTAATTSETSAHATTLAAKSTYDKAVTDRQAATTIRIAAETTLTKAQQTDTQARATVASWTTTVATDQKLYNDALAAQKNAPKNSTKAQKAALQKAVNDSSAILLAAQNSLTQAKTLKQQTAGLVGTATTSLTTARQNEAALVTKETAAKTTLDAATAAELQATQNRVAAQTAKNTIQSDLTAATDREAALQSDLTNVRAALAQCQTALDDLRAGLAQAMTDGRGLSVQMVAAKDAAAAAETEVAATMNLLDSLERALGLEQANRMLALDELMILWSEIDGEEAAIAEQQKIADAQIIPAQSAATASASADILSPALPAITAEMPPQERIAAYAERTKILDERIAILEGNLAHLDGRIAQEQTEMEDANALDAHAQEILQRWNEQQSAESVGITPTMNVTTMRLNRFMNVDFTDMPSGFYLTLDGNGVSPSDGQFQIPAGTGSQQFEFFGFRTEGTTDVQLRDPSGNLVSIVHTFRNNKDGGSKFGAGETDNVLQMMTYVPAIPDDQRITQTDVDAALSDRAGAALVQAECQGALTELGDERTSLLGEINALKRQEVPTAMMYVTSENASFRVHYNSPYEQTFFEVTIDQDGGAGYRGIVEHPAGAHNAGIDFDMARLSGSNGNGSVIIRMYSDAEKTELLDEFSGGYSRNTMTASGATEGSYEAFAQGVRITEHANGMTATLPMENGQGAVLLTSWNPRGGAAGSVGYQASEGSFTFAGTLASLDLSGGDGTVTDIFADIDIPEGTTVQALVFRSGKQIASLELRNGTPLIFSDAGGFSAVIFRASAPETLTLQDLMLNRSDDTLFSAETLSRGENIVLAQELATENWGEINNILRYPQFEYVLGANNIYNHRGGGAGAGNNQYYLLGYGGGTYDAYTLYKPDSTGSGAAFGNPHYLNDQGFFALPKEYYTEINGAIIYHIGAPKNGGPQVVSGNGVTATLAGTSDNIDDLLAMMGDFHPEISVMHLVNGPTDYTGFSDGFNEIAQVSRPVIAAGEQFHAVSLVYNPSGTAGTITVEVFTGDAATPYLAGTYTGRIDAYQRMQFVANAVSPANATGLPELRFRITLPDGTQYWSGGMRSAEADAAPGEARGAQISWTRGILEVIADQHGADSAQFRSAYAHLQESFGADVVSTAMRMTNVAGGGEVVIATTQTTQRTDVLSDGMTYTGSAADRIDVPAENNHIDGEMSIALERSAGKDISLVIREEKMVNIWVEGMAFRNLKISIAGGDLGSTVYTSEKGGTFNGESVSLKLKPGTYTVRIEDSTDYTGMMVENTNPVSVKYKIDDYDSANIRGMVSIEGSEKVMPVSIRVAAFNEDGKSIDKDPITQEPLTLDSNKPVWVVIHGRTDQEDSNQIAELARTMTKTGQQVITLDWRQMAKDNSLPFSLDGSIWINGVADWTVQQLQAMGFTSNQINLTAESWGTYVSNSIAMKLGHVNTIVALDPAADGYVADFLGNKYKVETIDFAKYSNHSVAIHSSEFGSVGLANTANQTITLTYPPNYDGNGITVEDTTMPIGSILLDKTGAAHRQHGFSITAFDALFEKAVSDPTSAAGKLLPLKQFASTITQADDSVHSTRTLATIPYYDAAHDWWKTFPDMNQIEPLLNDSQW